MSIARCIVFRFPFTVHIILSCKPPFLKKIAIGKINYTIAEIQAEKIHDDKNIGYYIYYERKYNTINRDDFKSYGEYLISKVLNYVARELMGYGEHLSKFFFYIICIINFSYIIVAFNIVTIP